MGIGDGPRWFAGRRYAGLVVALAALAGFEPTLWGQPPSPPGIEGEIDGPKALKWLYGNYDAAKKQSLSKNGRAVVVTALQDGVVDGKAQWFLYSLEGDECTDNAPICPLTLGAAVFERQGQFWVVKADDRELGNVGNDLHPPEYTPPAAKPVKWGTQAFGVLVNHRWFHVGDFDGATSLDQSLYGFENGRFRRIFNLQLSYEDLDHNPGPPGPESYWEAEWSFGPPGSDGIFDVAVKMKKALKLTKEERRDPTAGKGSYRRGTPIPGVYRYDGKMYRHVQTHAALGSQDP